MNKAHVTHLLSDYLAGDLPQVGAEKVKAHLTFCNACRQALTETEGHIATLKATPQVRIPEGLEGRVLTAARQELSQRPFVVEEKGFSWPSWLSPMRGLTLVATCAVVVLVVRNLPSDLMERAAPSLSGETQAKDQAPLAESGFAQIKPAAGNRSELSVADSTDLTGRGDADGSAIGSVANSVDVPLVAPNAPPVRALDEVRQVQPPEAVAPAMVEADPAKQDFVRTGRGARRSVAPDAETAAAQAPQEDLVARARMKLAAREEKADESAPVSATGGPLSTVLVGSRSAIETPQEIMVNSQDEWQGLWNRHTAGSDGREALPAVDFTISQVIAIFAGQKPTGGHRIEILEIAETTWNGDTVRVVRYRMVGPPPGVMAAQVISYPYLFQPVPRFEGKTFFEKRP